MVAAIVTVGPSLWFSTSQTALDRSTGIGHYAKVTRMRETHPWERKRGEPDEVLRAQTACGKQIDVTPVTWQKVETCKLCMKTGQDGCLGGTVVRYPGCTDLEHARQVRDFYEGVKSQLRKKPPPTATSDDPQLII